MYAFVDYKIFTRKLPGKCLYLRRIKRGFYAWNYIMRNILMLIGQILEVILPSSNQDINGVHGGNGLHRNVKKITKLHVVITTRPKSQISQLIICLDI